MNSLISIIIPVYKVEQYLDECMHSIIGQTYRNLEIILVDDGSPDGCPLLCDAYAKQDERIRVVHKPNGGLSDARNAGLAIATGEYIGFVDSDDCVELNMFETLLAKIEEYHTDIVSCKFTNYIDGRIDPSDIKTLQGYDEGKVLSLHDYFTEIVHEHLDNASWNKLYRKSILTERFCKGRNNEDYLFFSQLVKKHPEAKIAFTTETFYKYRQQREGSICADATGLWIANYINRKDIIGEIDSWHPALKPLLISQNEGLLFGIMYELCADSCKRKKHRVAFEMLHRDFVKLPAEKINANRLDVAIMKHCPSLYALFLQIRAKLKR